MENKIKTWDCKENISDKILLVYSDNDISATFKYSFLLKEVQKKVKKIIFITQKEIIKILKESNFNFEIYPMETKLTSLKYDYFINLSSLDFFYNKTDLTDKYLTLDDNNYRLYRAKNIINKRNFQVGMMFSSEINYDFYKIFNKIKDINIYLLNNEEVKYTDFYYLDPKDIYNLALAIKSMYIIITDNELIINLASALGKKVFAFYKNKSNVNKFYKNIKPYIINKNNPLETLLVKAKEDLEDYRISLREKYLLTLIKSIKSGAINNIQYKTTDDKIIDLLQQAAIYIQLLYETYNLKYAKKYISTEKKLLKIDTNKTHYLGNIATIQTFYINKKKEAYGIWKKILPEIIQKEDSNFLFNYSCLQCLLKNFSEFNKYYKYRFIKKHNPTNYPTFEAPIWNGEENVSDKTLLIYYEQGYGDNILFCRYINDIKHLFKKVIFVVRKQLENLMKESFPDIVVYAKEDFSEEKVHFDYHIPLISIFNILNVSPENYKKRKWLKVDKQKHNEYKKMFDKNKFNIGIFWESRKTHLQRFTNLKTLIPLGNIKHVQLYSLEIDKEDFEVNFFDPNVNIINIGKHFKDFYDTAAAIENCDLIISTDSSVLNLAGALGKKTFGLYNEFSEWRWYKLEGEDTGWYKSVKPFQTKKQNDFTEVIEKMKLEIEDLISKNERIST